MDGSARCVSPRATNHEVRRASQAPQWHSANTLDDSDTTPATLARVPLGTHAQTKSKTASRGRRCERDHAITKCCHRAAQLREIRGVRAGQCVEHNVERRNRFQLRCPRRTREFAQASLETIAIDCAALVTRHHDSNAMSMQKGSEYPNLELRGSDSLPFAADHQEVCRARQPPRRRHAARCLRRPRTSTGASR